MSKAHETGKLPSPPPTSTLSSITDAKTSPTPRRDSDIASAEKILPVNLHCAEEEKGESNGVTLTQHEDELIPAEASDNSTMSVTDALEGHGHHCVSNANGLNGCNHENHHRIFDNHDDAIEMSSTGASSYSDDDDDDDDDDNLSLHCHSNTTNLTAKKKSQELNHFFSSWTQERSIFTMVCCLSSCMILAIRLALDVEPSAYIIHSIVVFFDMILIHLFTHSKWLSLSGELLTVISFVAFHYSKETIFELLETTLIAVLCSIHLIKSRAKWIDSHGHLQKDVDHLLLIQNKQHGSISEMMQMELHNNHGVRPQEEEESNVGVVVATRQHEDDIESGIIECDKNSANRAGGNNLVPSAFGNHVSMIQQSNSIHNSNPSGANDSTTVHNLAKMYKTFFEHFLDGSAGVMYTSFIGLIIDELISLQQQE